MGTARCSLIKRKFPTLSKKASLVPGKQKEKKDGKSKRSRILSVTTLEMHGQNKFSGENYSFLSRTFFTFSQPEEYEKMAD